MRSPAALLLLLLLTSCRTEGPAPTAPSAPPAPPPDLERQNLLNIGYGAAVVSRTAELTLESSALRAIDGDEVSTWDSPPNDTRQTLVFSLPAPARIDQVGVRTPAIPLTRVAALTFEASADGEKFLPLAEVRPQQTGDAQFFDASFPDARYVRVTIDEAGDQFASLQSVHVRGAWLKPPSVASIADCWTINESPASFAEREGRVAGMLGADDAIQFDGGLHGAVYRVAWARGGGWGYGLISLSPDGKSLSGMKWHQDAAVHSFGGSWFGQRRPCRPEGMQPDRVVDTFLRSAGWYPLFSLRFDESDALIEPLSRGGLQVIERVLTLAASSPIALVAREYHEATPEGNRRRAETRLHSLRAALVKRGVDVSKVEFLPVGSSVPRRPTNTEAMRLLYGVVEIDITGTVRSGS